jgi:hypothetical protein
VPNGGGAEGDKRGWGIEFEEKFVMRASDSSNKLLDSNKREASPKQNRKKSVLTRWVILPALVTGASLGILSRIGSGPDGTNAREVAAIIQQLMA